MCELRKLVYDNALPLMRQSCYKILEVPQNI